MELPIFKMRNSTSNGCFCWHQFLTNGGKFHQKLVEITTIANGIKVGFSHPLGLTVGQGRDYPITPLEELKEREKRKQINDIQWVAVLTDT